MFNSTGYYWDTSRSCLTPTNASDESHLSLESLSSYFIYSTLDVLRFTLPSCTPGLHMNQYRSKYMLMVKLELRVTLPAERVKGQRHLSFVSMDPSFSLAKLFSFKSTGFSVWLDQTRFYYFNLILVLRYWIYITVFQCLNLTRS
jgi:hypothetical protein